jgi:hypothetical protein
MEASQQGDQNAQESQEQATQDSNLQTPQPDQPVPSEAERDAELEAEPQQTEAQKDESPGQPVTDESVDAPQTGVGGGAVSSDQDQA